MRCQRLSQNNFTVGITQSKVIYFFCFSQVSDLQGGYQMLTRFGLLGYREATCLNLHIHRLYRNTVSIEGEQRDSLAPPDFESLSVEYCTPFCNRTVSWSVSKCSSWSHSSSSASIAWTVFLERILRPGATCCNWKEELLWSATDMFCASICFAVRASSACHPAMNVAAKLVMWNKAPVSAYMFLLTYIGGLHILALSWSTNLWPLNSYSMLLKIDQARRIPKLQRLASGVCIG